MGNSTEVIALPASSSRSRSWRKEIFASVASVVLAAAIFHLLIQLFVYPTAIYWLSYYVPTYQFGFVRRGLGGEIVRLLPPQSYFAATYTMMWAPVLVWLVALAALLRQIIAGRVTSERRLMLAILVPVLPFAITYALYTPRPELWAMSGLVAFAIQLMRVTAYRSLLALAAGYGLVIAVLAFSHEGIPMQLALGTVVAIVVLGPNLNRGQQALSAAFAVGPGLVVVLLVAIFSRKDVGPLLCSQVPHRMIDNPYAASNTPQEMLAYLLGQNDVKTDFHDWTCQVTTKLVDAKMSDGWNLVASYGFGPLFASTVVGALYFALTMWAVQLLSGVPLRAFVTGLRDRPLLPALGLALIVPPFVMGVDWTRWWVLITFDVALVYILDASARPEIDGPAPARTVRTFAIVVVVLAVLPTGALLHLGGPNFGS